MRRNVPADAVIVMTSFSKEMPMKVIIHAAAAALLVVSGPALAGKSTPQEREATKQLNLEAAQQAKSTNQQLAAASPNATAPAPSAPAAAPTTPVDNGQAAEQANSPAAAAESPAGNSGIKPPAQ
jgi:hypothetical protein